MADLAKYVVALEAQTAKYEKQLKKANATLSKFHQRQTKSLDAIKRGIAALGSAAATRGLAVFIKNSIDAADRANKFAQQVGVATETITGLELSAQLAGVTMRDVEVGLRRFGRSMSDANEGLSTQTRAFKDLRVEYANADGTLRSVDDVLRDVADRFAQMEDGARKVARAQELFGRSGSLLIPMLNKGGQAIDDVINKSRDLGLVWSKEAAAAAEDFNDRLAVMGSIVRGAGNNLTKDLLPGLNDSAAALIIFNSEATNSLTIGSALGTVVRSLAAVFIGATAGLQAFGERLGALAATRDLILRGDFAQVPGVWEQFATRYEALSARLDKALDSLFADPNSRAKAQADDIINQLKAMQKLVNDGLGSTGAPGTGAGAGYDLFKGEGVGAAEQQAKAQASAYAKAFMGDTQVATAYARAGQDYGQAAANAYAQAFMGDTTMADAYAAALNEANNQSANDLARKYAAAITDTSLADAKENFVELFGTNMVQAADSGFDAILQSWARTLQQMAAKALASKVFDLLAGAGGGWGAAFSSLAGAFGGARAGGGDVTAGTSYLVGEEGPELWTASKSGYIVPNGALRGGGGGTHITVNAPNSDVGMLARIEDAVKTAVAISEQRRIEAERRG